ncbi:MAG: hypothetical protein QGF34_05075 [Candidatus Poseidoniaceae archaeon]|jgi:hypothetical protein|nr:hypothetical protein [Candidatus Poseidoniaceae archaeon]
MTGEGMTSVSVSYEVRRQLNTMRTVSGHKSVNTLLEDLIRIHKMARMRGEIDTLRDHLQRVADVNVDHLVSRLNMAPFEV